MGGEEKKKSIFIYCQLVFLTAIPFSGRFIRCDCFKRFTLSFFRVVLEFLTAASKKGPKKNTPPHSPPPPPTTGRHGWLQRRNSLDVHRAVNWQKQGHGRAASLNCNDLYLLWGLPEVPGGRIKTELRSSCPGRGEASTSKR